MLVQTSVLDTVLRVRDDRSEIRVVLLVARQIHKVDEPLEGRRGSLGRDLARREGRDKGDGNLGVDDGLESPSELFPRRWKTGIGECDSEILVGQSEEGRFWCIDGRGRLGAPCSFESLHLALRVDHVVFVELEGGEEGVGDVGHDEVEVGGGRESRGESESREGGGEVEECVVELEGRLEVRGVDDVVPCITASVEDSR
jgi:hypothetical protein